MRPWLALTLLILGGCRKDPVFFGIWDIVEASRGGVAQGDMGTLEIMRSGGQLATFLRYRSVGGGWEPDPTPTVLFGTHDAVALEDPIEGYHKKDETYTVFLSPWCDPAGLPLDVAEYGPNSLILSGPDQPWPGDTNRAELELVLER